jgi:hypothetical protein
MTSYPHVSRIACPHFHEFPHPSRRDWMPPLLVAAKTHDASTEAEIASRGESGESWGEKETVSRPLGIGVVGF